jgi:predicted aconitase with swiveling domain
MFDGGADGDAMVLSEPLSLWGGLDPQTGELTDAHHPQLGAQAVRSGHAPAAILLGEPDLILAVGAAVAAELYDELVPVLVLRPEDRDAIQDGTRIHVAAGGEITLG